MNRTLNTFNRRAVYRQQAFSDLPGVDLPDDAPKRKAGVTIVDDHKDPAAKQRSRAERMIRRIFLKLGFPAHMMGYVILQEAVLLCVEDQQRTRCLMHGLYPLLAEKFSCTSASIERDLRNLIAAAWKGGEPETARGLLGPCIFLREGKPTNGEMIALLTARILIELDKGNR